MGAELKPVGQAVAVVKGHYPDSDGRHLTILPGQTFTVFEGMTKGRWFTLLKPGAAAPTPVRAAEEVGPETMAAAAVAERKRKAAVRPPTADDIA